MELALLDINICYKVFIIKVGGIVVRVNRLVEWFIIFINRFKVIWNFVIKLIF